MENPRLFVAVALPGHIKSCIAEKTADWKKALPFRKWTHPDDVHITLKFLGETDAVLMPELERRLSACAGQAAPFVLTVSGVGTFGKPSAPSVLWIGIAGEMDLLRKLQSNVEREAADIGYPPEERAYSPHLTIARRFASSDAWNRDLLTELQSKMQDKALTWNVDEIVLYQSHLNRSPMYEPIRRWNLGPS